MVAILFYFRSKHANIMTEYVLTCMELSKHTKMKMHQLHCGRETKLQLILIFDFSTTRQQKLKKSATFFSIERYNLVHV